jgi:hypothetical protein
MDWMRLEKILKKFDLFGIQTHPIPLNPHGLRANRTSPYVEGNWTDDEESRDWAFFFLLLEKRIGQMGQPAATEGRNPW